MLHPAKNRLLNSFLPASSDRRFCVLLSCLLGVSLASSSLAHNIKTAQNVAATFHIEPNHNPKAGETAQAWFALTKLGGATISLEQCNCQLAVYADRRQPGDAPVLQPALKTIAAEQYQGIPGAEIVFPKAGIYELELSGTAKDNQSFQPFALSYKVTVQAGKTAAQTAIAAPDRSNPTAQVSSSETAAAQNSWIVPGVVTVALLGAGVVWFVNRKRV